MSPFEIFFSDYVRNLRCTAQSVPTLLLRLVQCAPRDMTPAERKALRVVEQAGNDVMAVQAERDRLSSAKVRPPLVAFVNAWCAMYDALGAAARVAVQNGDVIPRERMIVASLFPDGISFTQLDAESAFGEGFRRLDRMRNEHLERPIVEIIGKRFVLAARKTTTNLGEALGIGASGHPKPKGTGMQESLARFGRAVGAYARALAADCDETDAAQAQRFLHAMSPIDQYRANVRANGGSDAASSASAISPAANEPPVTAVPVTAVPLTAAPVSAVPVSTGSVSTSPVTVVPASTAPASTVPASPAPASTAPPIAA